MLTRMVGLSAFVSPDSFVVSPKVYKSMFKPTYHILGTLTSPAAVTRSMGLPSDALLSWFLHRHLPNFIPGVFLGRLSGHRHLDHFILTSNLSPLIGTVQKHMPTLTQTAPNPTTGPLCLSLPAAP
jgi:hypothetical protein